MDRESQMIMERERLAQEFQDIPVSVIDEIDFESLISRIKNGSGMTLELFAKSIVKQFTDEDKLDQFVNYLGRAIKDKRNGN